MPSEFPYSAACSAELATAEDRGDSGVLSPLSTNPIRRRRWPWVIALALVALMAGIIFWPRHDGYAFLRRFHPKESYEKLMGRGETVMPYHAFDVDSTYAVVRGAILQAGWKMTGEGVPEELEAFTLPSGKKGFIKNEDDKFMSVFV